MLTSLIAVLVLLVIGFYALIVGAVGRAGAAEGLLAPGRRLLMMALGGAALGIAFLIYSYPGSVAPSSTASRSWNAAPGPAQENPGDAAVAAVADAATAVVEERAAASAEPPSSEPAVPAEIPSSQPSAAAAITPAAGEPEGSQSAAALALELELLRRRQGLPQIPATSTPAPAPPPPEAVAVKADPAPAAVECLPAARPPPVVATTRKTAAAQPRRPVTRAPATGTGRSTATPALAGAALTIRIHNELGEAQEFERLSLAIEGRPVVRFEVDTAAPSIELPVRLPRPGLLHYRIEGESLQGEHLGLSGEGYISAVEGARFHVRRWPGSQQLFLEAARG